MTPSQITVQSCHAIIEISAYLKEHPHLVLIGVKDENSFIKVKEKLENNNIFYKEFIEPDLNNSLTAIATEAISGEKRLIFKNYTLL